MVVDASLGRLARIVCLTGRDDGRLCLKIHLRLLVEELGLVRLLHQLDSALFPLDGRSNFLLGGSGQPCIVVLRSVHLTDLLGRVKRPPWVASLLFTALLVDLVGVAGRLVLRGHLDQGMRSTVRKENVLIPELLQLGLT